MNRKNHGASAPAADPAALPSSILESIGEGVFTVDAGFKVTYFNRAAEAITGVPRAQAVGRPCWEVFKASLCESGCALKRTMANGRPLRGEHAFIVRGDGARVPISLSTALLRDGRGRVIGGAETFRDLTREERLEQALEERFTLGGMVSRSPALRALKDLLPRAAASAAGVLVTGETGTGKELMARALHQEGPRAAGPFVAVNCAALPEALLESELFGHKAGAFTGAVRDQQGQMALANGGTLFLDEVGDMPLSLQAKMLRALQEKSFRPLGAQREVKVDVRVIAATHRDLAAMANEGTFRRDLYYRLNVLELRLPPLRERRTDIPLLAAHFLERHRLARGGPGRQFSPEAMALLMAHDWPGNVRELENAVEHALALCPEGTILPRHLPAGLQPAVAPRLGGGWRARQDHARSQAIVEALRAEAGNVAAAAKRLGMHRASLYRQMRRLGLEAPEGD